MLERDKLDAVESELQRLAAARAAIDPARRRTRRDILASAAVGRLSTHGELTTAALHTATAQIFQTQAATEHELEESLREAQQAGLVRLITGPNGECHWQATPGAIAESKQDREWAESALGTFQEDVSAHLDALGCTLKPDQAARASQVLLDILATGCRKSADGHTKGVEVLRPIEFDRAAVHSALQRVEPQSFREALNALFLAVIDPDDSFGTEIVHLLVVSSVLIAFIKKRDIAAASDLSGVRLLLDTEIIVKLVDDGTPEQKVVLDLIRLSKALGAEVMVAEHSLNEWARIWDSADQEHPGEIDSDVTLGNAGRLTKNPFINQFLRAKDKDPTVQWRRFQISKSDVRPLLEKLGVNMRASGNDRTEDQEFALKMREAMADILSSTNRYRAAPAVAADAESAAMVARWRSKYGAVPCTGYFVGADALTGPAYKRVNSTDITPLTVRPEAWLMYTAYLTGDGSDLSEVADVVSSAVVRESFFDTATAYTLDEVVKLSALLREDHEPMSLEVSREAAQLDLNTLLDGDSPISSEAVVRVAGLELMQRRSARRDARAKRAERVAVEFAAISDAKVAVADDRAAKAEDDTEEVRRALEEAKSGNLKLKRQLRIGAFGAVLFVAFAALLFGGVIHGWVILWTILGLGLFSIEAVRYVTLNKSGLELILSEVVAAIWVVAAWAMGKGH